MTDRGDVIGVLAMLLPAVPDPDTVDYIAAAAHALGYVVIVNRRFTDLFEWGSTQPAVLVGSRDPTSAAAGLAHDGRRGNRSPYGCLVE